MNKPVAYWDGKHFASKDKSSLADIPLYTHPVNPKYDPETGEPLIDGYPLFSGLPHPVKELSRMDVYELAIESGFMLSTQYGEAEHKLMPVSDGDTLVKLANAILRKAQE